MSARDAFDPATDALELRVLSGCHVGARVPALDGLSVGADENADVVLTDLAPSVGAAVLALHPQGRWSLRPKQQLPKGQGAAVEQAYHGAVHRFGGLALSVAPKHNDWPSILPQEAVLSDGPVPDLSPEAAAEPTDGAPVPAPARKRVDSVAPESLAPAPAGKTQTGWLQRQAHSSVAIALAALVVAALALAAVMLLGWAHAPGVAAVAINPLAPVDPAAQQRQVRDIQLTIAQVNPSLRLQVQPLPDGRVRVGGWVDSTAEWDRLAEALGGLRPLPLLQVRELGELRDELCSHLGPEMRELDFETTGAAGLRVTGLVLNAEERARALAALRAVLPADVELVDGLELAEKQAPAFAAALRAAGFPNANALWDGRQALASLSLTAPERGRLEQTLVQLARRFRGLAFTVDMQLVHLDGGSADNAPIHAVPMDRAGLPFQIRSVVSGASSFLLLSDGSRVIVGGSIKNWRLQAVEPSYLLFDGPRRVAVLR